MEVLRNMWRRKFRSFLTIMGISIGIFAFTVMGSLALKFNKMISGGKDYVTGQITIMPKGTSFSTGATTSTLPVSVLDNIAKVDGVEAVMPTVQLALSDPDPDNPAASSASFGTPPTIVGSDYSSAFKNKNWDKLAMKEGHNIIASEGDDKVAIGISISADKKLHVGDKMTIRGKDFTVVGVADRTNTGPDSYIFMNIKPAREMLIESNPFLKSLKDQADKANAISAAALAQLPADTQAQLAQAKTFKVEDVNSMAAASWKDGYDPETVVKNIKDKYKNEVLVMSPKELGDQIDKASVLLNAVILGSALIALIVGGFSVINTMIMSVSERTKEIGVKKAIGASGWTIAKEYTFEAGVIGILGGLIGMGLGLLMITIVNHNLADKGAEIFLVQNSFLAEVVLFSFCLGIVAGIIPAWRASRLKVVDAIREL
ncbi:MAG: ABC transporter permease [Patescibacteria group bacterium]|jgi:putative ABC transport system permease protein